MSDPLRHQLSLFAPCKIGNCWGCKGEIRGGRYAGQACSCSCHRDVTLRGPDARFVRGERRVAR